MVLLVTVVVGVVVVAAPVVVSVMGGFTLLTTVNIAGIVRTSRPLRRVAPKFHEGRRGPVGRECRG